MADRGRDLKVGILSDASKFDLSEPAQDLDRLGDHAVDTGREMDRLADSADDAGRRVQDLGRDTSRAGRDLGDLERDAKAAGDDVERLGEDTEATARKVDASFDAIARSSRTNLRQKLSDDADVAESKLGDVRDEGIDTAREMGASFSGSADDITDAFQEVAANALQAFGAIGTGVGVAAAVGIGFLRAQTEKLKAAVGELTSELIDAGGRLGNQHVLDKLRQFADEGSINDLAEQARRAKVPVEDFLLAQAGDPAAIERVQRLLGDQVRLIREQVDATGQANGTQAAQLQNVAQLNAKLEGNARAYGLAQRAADLYLGVADQVEEQTRLGAETLDAYGAALTGFVDPLGDYTELLASKEEAERASAQATADATEDAGDSWEDYAKRQDVTIGELIAQLERDVAARHAWADNLEVLAGRASQDLIDELVRMGEEGAPLVQKLVDATDAELGRYDELFRQKSASATQALVDELDGAAGPAGAAGANAGRQFAEGLRQREALIAAAARQARAAAQRYLDGSPLTVRTELDPSGYEAGLRSLVGRGARVRV